MDAPFLFMERKRKGNTMKKTFTINGKKYTPKVFDFNLLCDMEDAGVTLESMTKKPMSAVRAYFTACYGGDAEGAGREIEQHIINGGEMTELMNAMSDAMSESDFFRSLAQNNQEEVPED